MFEDLAAAQQTQTLMKRFNEMKANFFSLLMTLSFSKSRPPFVGSQMLLRWARKLPLKKWGGHDSRAV